MNPGGALKLETATDKTLTVNSVVLNGGTLDVNNTSVTVNSLTVKGKGSTALKKGSYGKITITADAVDGSKTAGSLLNSGYGFRAGTEQSTVWYDSTSTATELADVIVHKLWITGVTLEADKVGDYTYGDTVTLTVATESVTETKTNFTWYEVGENGSETKLGTTQSAEAVHTSSFEIKSPLPGTHTYRVYAQTHLYTKASDPITVTVNKKNASLNVSITGWTYGEYDAAVNAPQFEHPDGASEPVITYTWDGAGNPSTVVPAAVKAGAFTVTVQYETATEIRSGSATFNVIPRTLTVTALNRSAYVGDKVPDLSAPVQGTDYTVEGLVGSDTVDVILTCTPDMTKTGTYDIVPTISGEKAGNYTLTAVHGTLTVTNRPDNAPSYPVILESAENGSLKSSHRHAEAGDTVTLTVTPDSGYTLETITVTDRKGAEVKLTAKNGKYTFKMPAGKVTVTATFMDDNTMLNFFVDVPADQYYYDAVLWAAKNGITGGMDETHFAPNSACTRAQIVTFLYRWAVANGVDVSVGEDTNILSYNDAFTVPEYAVSAFQWAVGAGIVQGSNGDLMPNQTCTRAQAVTFLFRFAAANGMDFVTLQELVSGYSDAASVPGYALSAFNWALAGGIVTGNNGALLPNNDCTRAQIVTFLYRLLGE